MSQAADRYRALLDHLPDGYARHEVVLNDDGSPVDYIFLEVNPAFEALTGLSRDRIIGRRITEVLPGIKRSTFDWIATYGQVAQSGEPITIERYSEPLDRWYEVTSYSDEPGRFTTLFHDVTERRRTEKALEDQRIVREQLLEQTLAGYWDRDIARGTEYMSPTLKRMLGYEPHELADVPESRQALAFPEDLPDLFARERQHFESHGRVPFSKEVRYRHRNGSTIWVICSGRVISWDEDGNPLRMVGSHVDITGLKHAEESLRAREERFRAIMSSMQDIVFTLDTSQRHTAVYGPWVEHSGLTSEHFLGKTSREILGEEAARVHEEANKRALGGEFVVYDWSAPSVDGLRHYQTSLSPIRDAEGSVQGIVGIGRDVTERTRTQREVETSHTLLQQVVQGTLDVIQQMTEARDPYTSGHQRRVAELAEAIAREMRLPEDSCVAVIRTAAFIHDIGKITVPAEILSKPGQLSPTEFELIKVHPTTGYNILRRAHLPDPVAETVLQHHERLDGTGYPQQLKGDDILPEAQILAVADVVEAMSSHRPYRPAPGTEAALSEIAAHSGTRYDPDVVQACLTLLREKRFSFSC